ncbi:MAG: ATP-binding protein [Chloroflexi bacterium]|nr:ATP-binding protein [Chloroflexota bacterium]
MSKLYPFWRTLRFRFAVWISLFLFVILIAFSLFLYRSLKSNLSDALDDSLRDNAVQVATFIDLEDPNDVNPPSDRSISIRVLDSTGAVIYSTGTYQHVQPSPRIFETVLNGQELFTTLADPFDGDDNIRLFIAPLSRDGEIVGAVQTVQSLDGIDDPLEQLLVLLEISVPLFVLIVGIGGYWLAGRALAPIDRITETAARISTEDLSTRLDLPPTHDEVGRLATTFNTMLVRLEEAFRREKQFTSDASHELRTPLATTRTIAETTLNRPRSAGEYEEALRDILEEVLRMQRLAEDLLHLAREDGFDTVQESERINIGELLHDVVDSVQRLAEAKALTLTCNATENLFVEGDSGALMRMFINLLDNAIKYTPSGEVTVTAHQTVDHQVEVIIKDTGIGIATSHLPHIFDRFYRGDPSRTAGGTGLGLTIAQAIAHAHGGKLTIESEENAGTTCIFTMPLAAQPHPDVE